MKRFGLAALVGLAAGIACGGNGSPTSPPPVSSAGIPATPEPPPPPRVVILSIDGLRPDALVGTDAREAAAPNILGLARRGAYTWRAQTVGPSETLPAHASMLSGVSPSVHRQTWDDWEPRRGFISVPTVFTVAKTAGLRTLVVTGKEKLQHLNVPGSVDTFIVTPGGDDGVANEAMVQMQQDFDLMFLHFPDVDLGGHRDGWMSATYAARVATVDRAIGRVLSVLPRGTTVILTADHGGSAKNHAMNIPENMSIPWIIAGPRVPPQGELSRTVRTMDTAATALFVLGLNLPAGCQGVPLADVLMP
jgi:predicted AlkP superfamily pyrophosphatase or phosphodiesterase